jgi:thiamine kinase-like enzyme
MKKIIEKSIKRIFPRSKIISYSQFKEGLVNPTYKVFILNPRKKLVLKLYNLENQKDVEKTINIFKYLYSMEFPVPEIYSNFVLEGKGVVIMNYISGESGLKVYNKSSILVKRNLLKNVGKLLKKLHKVDIPSFWIHSRHEVKSEKEWINWTQLRIKKYLKFVKENMEEKYYKFLKREFSEFFVLLKKDISFVPLHWDYHLENLISTKEGKIIGLLDFDNAMKGHSYSDIGQSKYYLRFFSDDYKNFDYFLKGYGIKTKVEKKLIQGYFLLHLVAITRNLWNRKKHVKLIEKHYQIFDELMN